MPATLPCQHVCLYPKSPPLAAFYLKLTSGYFNSLGSEPSHHTRPAEQIPDSISYFYFSYERSLPDLRLRVAEKTLLILFEIMSKPKPLSMGQQIFFFLFPEHTSVTDSCSFQGSIQSSWKVIIPLLLVRKGVPYFNRRRSVAGLIYNNR